ncbi:MAG TPA: type II toxin-antitoxin system VapC family toxin [Phytomonospora sp.]
MIVVDSSALVAIAAGEPDALKYATAIEHADAIWLSPVNYVETAMVLLSRRIVPSRGRLDDWLTESGVIIREDVDLADAALGAFLRFGRGNHPARLNLGDCFSYALAKTLDAPLLYKGDDFAQTDVRSAL